MHLRQEFINGHAADGSPHLGQILMENFNKPGDHIWQIDAGTGEVEMKSSVRSRSIQLARCLRNAGLKPGDVVAVSGVNRLNLHIPFYAGYLNGLPVSGIDPSFRYEEIKNMFRIIDPKLVFCEVFNVADYEKVVKDLGLDAKVVTFGGSEKSYAKFVQKFDENLPESEFKVAIFDANKVFGWLVSTSGTTGPPKAAAFSHTEIIKIIKITSIVKQKEIAPMLSMSSVQWISAYLSTMCMISANQIKVCTSAPATWEHVIDIINKYKPVLWTTCPFVLNNIMNHNKYCDLTCFTRLVVTGFAMNRAFLQKLKARIEPNGAVWVLFGQTECLGGVLIPAPDGPLGNCGEDFPLVPVQLVDTNTGEVITEPNRTGELWTKGPRLTEYYKNPEATAAAFSPDGWFKTGDLLYRDENGYYFFVERISSAFRCLSFFVTPMELEHVIQQHPDVVDVCVVGVPHPEDNMHPVACVQKRPGSTLTEQDVKDMISDGFSWEKHLHGGVIFVDDFPRTFSDKIARAKVRKYVLEHRRAACEYPSSGNTKKCSSAPSIGSAPRVTLD